MATVKISDAQVTATGSTTARALKDIAADVPHAGGAFINVKGPPYNAKGDGITDDTAAVQAAFDAVPAAGGVVFFPVGTYWGNRSRYTVKSGTIIRGASRASTVIYSTLQTNDIMFDCSTVVCRFEHLTLRGPGSTGGTGVKFGNGAKYRSGVYDVEAFNLKIAFEITATYGLQFSDVLVRACTNGWKIHDGGSGLAGAATDITLLDCKSNDPMVGSTVLLQGYVEGIRILAGSFHSAWASNCLQIEGTASGFPDVITVDATRFEAPSSDQAQNWDHAISFLGNGGNVPKRVSIRNSSFGGVMKAAGINLGAGTMIEIRNSYNVGTRAASGGGGALPLTTGSGVTALDLSGNFGNSATTNDTIFGGTMRLASTTGPIFVSGSGSPLNVIAAPIGSVYLRTDGGAATSLYVKESGTDATGWVAK